ncbi:MAG: LAGLIDADG family homing endonuclease [Candidatus Micrarchaeota archaeon]|nr:LAGLIDADG family homing endonuclease [Candidatus Micrarchaeota archaeon]
MVGLESINHRGILQIQASLHKIFGIVSSVKKRKNRNTWALAICGRDDITKFQKHIGFLHPKKEKNLIKTLNSYVDYNWHVPSDQKLLIKFVKQKAKISYKRKQVRFTSIVKSNLINLRKKLLKLNIKSHLRGPWSNPQGSIWYCLTIKIDVFNKLIKR